MFHLEFKGRGKQHGDFKADGQQMCTKGICDAKQFIALFKKKKNKGGRIFGYVIQNNNNSRQENLITLIKIFLNFWIFNRNMFL